MAFLLKRFPALQKIFFFRWVFPKIGGTPKSSILIGFSIIKPSILGYPYFWKHPDVPQTGFFLLLRDLLMERERFFFRRKSWNFQCMNGTSFFSTKINTFLGDNKNPRFLFLTRIIHRAFSLWVGVISHDLL